jgi:hypothetical protein
MIPQPLDASLLHRYWFPTTSRLGIGVSAYSVEDAKHLLETTAPDLIADIEPTTVIEDVDIHTLDQNHVIPNMGPPTIRGIWYPRLNV